MGGFGDALHAVGVQFCVGAVTTGQLLLALQQVCQQSSLVDNVQVRAIDADTLSARVYLNASGVFISAFYNITTDKTAFALVENNERIYGVDNAKMGWHVHPFHNPTQHLSCLPVGFGEFLGEVEKHYHARGIG